MKRLFISFVCIALSLCLYAGENTVKPVAKKAPDWMSEGVMYQIWPRSFTIEGTLEAAMRKLPEVTDLGATIVYLCPIMYQDRSMDRRFWSPRQQVSPANNPRNPYRIMDYTRVDPEYGTEEDFKIFVTEAHKLGLKVILDLVYLHTGPSSDLMLNPDNYKKDENGDILINRWNFPELDFSNMKLREYLITNMVNWVKEYKFDGWRSDVSGGIPLDFWEDARVEMEKINPEIGMLAESDTPNELLKAFDASYGFGWYSTVRNVFYNGETALKLKEKWLEMNTRFPYGSLFIRWVDNHDQDRPEVMFSRKGSQAANVLNFMIDGIPFIYNGQEIGDSSPYGIEYYPEKSYKDNGAINWQAQAIPKKKALRDWYQKLITLRKTEPVLKNGETFWLETDNPDNVIAFLRYNNEEEILTVINVSNRIIKDVKVKMPKKNRYVYNTIWTTEEINEVTVVKEGINIPLGSFGYYVCKYKQAN